MPTPRIHTLTTAAARILAALMISPVHAADKLFAAPSPNDAVASSSAGSAGHVTLALLAVLLCVFAAAWLLKQMRKLQSGPQSEIKIVAQVAVGTKERAVLLQIKNVQILVGVTASQVNTLHTFQNVVDVITETPAANTVNTPTNQHSFQSILKRSLGLL